MLPNAGACKLETFTPDGHVTERTFYDANVEMPILAVSELSKEGTYGSEVRLRQKDGFLRDLFTGRTQPIVKRRGVYFIKMFIRKQTHNAPEAGFTRPVHR